MSKLSDIKKEDLKNLTPEELADLKVETKELLLDIEEMIAECKENLKREEN